MEMAGDAPTSSGDPPPTCDMAIQAVLTLNHNEDPQEKIKASAWLTTLQKSIHAWKISDEMLHKKMNVDSCYFAAHTMRTKIQTSFAELPPEAHLSLRDSLLEHVNNITEEADGVIVRQLCLALADLMLQMPEWKNSLIEVIQRFGQNQPLTLLEVLVLFPEEINSRLLGANRRDEVTLEIRNATPIVMDFLTACLTLKSRHPTRLRIDIFRCLMSWIAIGAIPLDNIQHNAVMIHAFDVLKNLGEDSDVHETATDLVCSLLERLEDIDDRHGACGALELNIFTVVRNLESTYLSAMAHEDFCKALNFCRIFTEFAESMLLKIVSFSSPASPHFALSIFDSVLICCGHPDYEIADVTFNLWYRLSEEVYNRNNDMLTAIYRPYIERLMSCLCRHCQMEPDSEGLLEDGEEFAEFRFRVFELIKDIVFIVGSSNVFRRMYEYLLGVSNWEVMEAALFVMSAVARNISVEDNETVPPVLESILGLPENAHIAVKLTSLKLVGELGEWIDKRPHYLEKILNWFLVGLHDPKLSSEAATGLQNICSLCRRHMGPHFDGLIQILKLIDNFNLKPMAANGLIKGVATILTNMPHENIQEAMKTLCWLQIAPLNALLDEHNLKIVKNSKVDPVLYLDRLASIFRHVNPVIPENAIHPCQSVISEIWPVLSRTCDKFQEDNRITERCCRTIRFAIRCVGTQSAPMLEPLVKQMVTIYSCHPHSCFLYLGSILVDEFSGINGCVPGLLSMMEAFLPKTFQLLQAENGLRNNPDTVDDFFRLNARFLQRAPIPYLQTSYLSSIVDCGLMSVFLDHREANASVMKFFFDLLHCGRSKDDRDDFHTRSEIVTKLKDAFGPRLLSNLVRAAVFQLPSYTFHDIGDVIYEIMQFDRTVVCKWLEEALKALPSEGPNGMETVTKKQLVHFHKEVTKAEQPKDVSDAIRQFSRLWK